MNITIFEGATPKELKIYGNTLGRYFCKVKPLNQFQFPHSTDFDTTISKNMSKRDLKDSMS